MSKAEFVNVKGKNDKNVNAAAAITAGYIKALNVNASIPFTTSFTLIVYMQSLINQYIIYI